MNKSHEKKKAVGAKSVLELLQERKYRSYASWHFIEASGYSMEASWYSVEVSGESCGMLKI